VLLTGAGTRLLLEALERRWPGGDPLAALKKATLAARGPKTVKALKDRGLPPAVVSLSPATSESLLGELKKARSLSGARVYVQEYGERNDSLLEALRAEGALATPLTLYSWALPDSLEPLQSAIEACIAGRIEVALFTSARQVANLFLVAGRSGKGEALRQALGRMVVGSIGPVTDEALEEHGLAVDVRPEVARMGQLVAAAAERAPVILAGKVR
jgi:uroporphyrinogen-III synthase